MLIFKISPKSSVFKIVNGRLLRDEICSTVLTDDSQFFITEYNKKYQPAIKLSSVRLERCSVSLNLKCSLSNKNMEDQ